MKNDEDVLQNYSDVLSNLKDFVNQDLMVIITNKTHIVYYFAGDKMKLKQGSDIIGAELDPNDPLREVMKTGKRKVHLVSKELQGFAFASISNAIRGANGEIIGGIGVAQSLEREEKIEEISQGLADTIQEVNSGLQEVASGSQGLSSNINKFIVSANESALKIKEIDTAITAITDIAAYSNLLGLNAAIEAARAGEEGRGFAVVADEMRKLATQSSDSAKMVSQILTQMKDSIESIITEINDIGSIAENQAAATEEITASLEEVSEKSRMMADYSTLTV